MYYPHHLQLRDDNGEWQNHAACRDQPNDKGKPIPLADGKYYVYSSLIFMDSDEPVILRGEDIRVVDERGAVRLEGEVKRISVDDYHIRIWI